MFPGPVMIHRPAELAPGLAGLEPSSQPARKHPSTSPMILSRVDIRDPTLFFERVLAVPPHLRLCSVQDQRPRLLIS